MVALTTAIGTSLRFSFQTGFVLDSLPGWAPVMALPDHEGPWYDPAALEDLHDIGLAFVDGPPGSTGPQARYPMVPLLVDRFAARCAIVLDDANRREERGVTERWMAQLDGFTYRFLNLTRGAGLFQRGV